MLMQNRENSIIITISATHRSTRIRVNIHQRGDSMGRDNSGIWEKIQKSAQDTERLMNQKKYNAVMVKAKQTIEYMIRLQCDRAGIVEGKPDKMVRDLYEEQWITKSAAEHYLQILSIGAKASRDGDDDPAAAASAARILSQEFRRFSKENKSTQQERGRSVLPSGRQSRSRRRNKSALSGGDILKLLIPIILVVVLIFLIRILTPKKDPTSETTAPPATTATTAAPTTEPLPTVDPTVEETTTTAAATAAYKTTATLNVRNSPSSANLQNRIGKLDPGVAVEYVRDHDAEWAVIMYNGQEAYVSKQYLTASE